MIELGNYCMQVEIKSVLYDIQQAVSLIEEFTLDADFTDYQEQMR